MPRPEGEDLFTAAPLPIAPLDDEQRLACLRLIRSDNVGPATFRALINRFGGASEALSALPDLGRRAGRQGVRVYPREAAEAEIAAAAEAGVHLLFTIEPRYPAALAFTEGAPPLIYAKGRLDLLNRPAVAIVGSRQASAAGIQIARTFAARLGEAGIVIASGLARGIDGAAHQASLATGTVAVVAGGIDNIYPPEHRQLHAAIGESGCLLTELPMGFQPRAQDFPRRNRIISGLSRAVVVVEAAKRSGTLITARLANEQGRDVFAVPGSPLDPRAEGTNQLIKEGATLATSPEDVLAALSGQLERPRFALEEAMNRAWPADAGLPIEAAASGRATAAVAGTIGDPHAAPVPEMAVDQVEHVLGYSPVSMDDVARATGLPSRDVQAAIMELALSGMVEFHGGQLVSLRPRGS